MFMLQADNEFVELLARIRSGDCPRDKLAHLLRVRGQQGGGVVVAGTWAYGQRRGCMAQANSRCCAYFRAPDVGGTSMFAPLAADLPAATAG